IGTPNQQRFLKQETASSAWAFIRRARKRAADLSKRASRTFGRCEMASSFAFNSARTQCNSRKRCATISIRNRKGNNEDRNSRNRHGWQRAWHKTGPDRK